MRSDREPIVGPMYREKIRLHPALVSPRFRSYALISALIIELSGWKDLHPCIEKKCVSFAHPMDASLTLLT